jgi:DNA-binding CsgD family transcriptional regulator
MESTTIDSSASDSLSRRIASVIQAVLAAPVAFCMIADASLGRCRRAGSLIADGATRPLSARDLRLLAAEAMPDGAREWQADFHGQHDRLLSVAFVVGDVRVCAGVARPDGGAPFDAADRRRLDDFVLIGCQLVVLHAECLEHRRRELVLQSLQTVTDACCVVDLALGHVIWTYELQKGRPCIADVLREEPELVRQVAGSYAATAERDQPYDVTLIGETRVVRIAELPPSLLFAGARIVAVALVQRDKAPIQLSIREQQVAQLLMSGYSTLNAAAILSLSENTVRTYLRRLYRKLEITNRADLTRKCRELHLHVAETVRARAVPAAADDDDGLDSDSVSRAA